MQEETIAVVVKNSSENDFPRTTPEYIYNRLGLFGVKARTLPRLSKPIQLYPYIHLARFALVSDAVPLGFALESR